MKKLCSYLILLLAASVFCGCSKQGNSLFGGYYSFKTSGTLTVETTILGITDTTTVNLTMENGQMNILSEDAASGKMKITMNIVGSDVVVYDATASGEVLTIPGSTRAVNLPGDWDPSKVNVTVSGTGRKYDKVVILDLKYSGSTGAYRIIDSNIKCVGRENS